MWVNVVACTTVPSRFSRLHFLFYFLINVLIWNCATTIFLGRRQEAWLAQLSALSRRRRNEAGAPRGECSGGGGHYRRRGSRGPRLAVLCSVWRWRGATGVAGAHLAGLGLVAIKRLVARKTEMWHCTLVETHTETQKSSRHVDLFHA